MKATQKDGKLYFKKKASKQTEYKNANEDANSPKSDTTTKKDMPMTDTKKPNYCPNCGCKL
jgi:hypothetical protein